MYVTIEGNIGAGKTTVLEAIAREFGEQVVVQFEPLDEWEQGGLLAAMYRGEISHLEFQLMIMTSLAAQALQESGRPVIQERSLAAAFEVFGRVNVTDQTGFTLLRNTYQSLTALVPVVNKRIYLRAPVKIVAKRRESRSRASEENITTAYLQKIHEHHDLWLLQAPNVIVVDASGDVDVVSCEVISIIRELLSS